MSSSGASGASGASAGGGPPMPKHAPYPSTMAGLGGLPTKTLDDPITAVFLFLFVVAAIAHMYILQTNRKRGHKFLISGALFGFCMARIMATTLRLVWSTHTTNISVAIAAQIFVAAGVLLLFIVNLIFTQRVMRAMHPHTFGWSKWFSLIFKIYFATIPLMLIALITCVIQQFYTLDTNIRRIDRSVQLVGATYFAAAAFAPLPLLAISFLLPRTSRLEKFGEGRFRTKIAILLSTTVILTLGAAFRAGTSYVPRPLTNPAWYHSKECFYLFDFTIEIIVVYLYAIVRVDRRFHVPDASHGPGDYLRRTEKDRFAHGAVLDEEHATGIETQSEERKNTRDRSPFPPNKFYPEPEGNGKKPTEVAFMSPAKSEATVVGDHEGTRSGEFLNGHEPMPNPLRFSAQTLVVNEPLTNPPRFSAQSLLNPPSRTNSSEILPSHARFSTQTAQTLVESHPTYSPSPLRSSSNESIPTSSRFATQTYSHEPLPDNARYSVWDDLAGAG